MQNQLYLYITHDTTKPTLDYLKLFFSGIEKYFRLEYYFDLEGLLEYFSREMIIIHFAYDCGLVVEPGRLPGHDGGQLGFLGVYEGEI